MSSFGEIQAIEESLAACRKLVSVSQDLLLRLEPTVGRLETALQESQRQLAFHVSNREHARKRAEVADINEYARILQHIEAAQGTVNDHQVQLAQAKASIAQLKQKIADTKADIQYRLDKLAAFGQLVQPDVAAWQGRA